MIVVDAKMIASDLGSYLRKVENGETILIAIGDRSVAELRPVDPQAPATARPCGLSAGEFVVPDDFDAPLPEAALVEFEGK